MKNDSKTVLKDIFPIAAETGVAEYEEKWCYV